MAKMRIVHAINGKVPPSHVNTVREMEKLLGTTALHQHELGHQDERKIMRMIKIFEKYKEFSKLPAPKNPDNPTDFRQIDERARKFVSETVLPEFESDPLVQIVEKLDLSGKDLHIKDEFGRLKEVYVRLPHNLDWGEPINAQEAAMQNNRPDRLLACMQHANFIDLLLSFGAKVVIGYADVSRDLVDDLDSQGRQVKRPAMPEEVYTRDVVQVVGKMALLGNMTAEVRKPETSAIINAHFAPRSGNIEYGDLFMVSWGKVIVTTGDRTQHAAVIEALQNVVQHHRNGRWEVEILEKVPNILHGDCVMGAIPGKNGSFAGAYWFPEAFENKKQAKEALERHYGSIIGQITEDTRRALGANLLWLNEELVILNRAAASMKKLLEKFGKTVLSIDLGEIAKGDGSGRCSSAPLSRD
jgi:N-dimethylarginine dimethylaminohydrolase